jgi:hypothetical protein
LSVNSCGLQPAAESVYTPDAKASGYGDDDGVFCQSIAVGFSPQRKASIRQTLKRPAMAMMMAFFVSQ